MILSIQTSVLLQAAGVCKEEHPIAAMLERQFMLSHSSLHYPGCC